jgi:NAD(P)-dependent dehydrogenase (short-subunit alcohol dehydrogenase family)
MTSGFGFSSTALDVVATHDLTGRNAIVTGGASGLGRETVRALATAGARVTIAARDVERAEPEAAQLRTDTGNAAIDVKPLDVASLRSVRRFADGYLADGRPVHLLINNAGIMRTPLYYTEDGFEAQFGTNHVGHHALTVALVPALRAAGNARVVALSSRAHWRGDVDFDDLDFRRRPYDTMVAYGQSKTANALFAVGMTQQYAAEGITTNAVMPGFILTQLQRHMSSDDLRARGWIDESGALVDDPGRKTPAQGAATSVWAAVAPELDGVSGRYLEDCAIADVWTRGGEPGHGYLPFALDPEHASRLWTTTEQLVAR